MEEEQRGESLLAVEGLERSVAHLAVNEVESDWLDSGGCPMKNVEKVVANRRRRGVGTTLRVAALDERDLDLMDDGSVNAMLLEEPDVGRDEAIRHRRPRR